MDTNLLEQIVSEDFLLGTFKKRKNKIQNRKFKIDSGYTVKGTILST